MERYAKGDDDKEWHDPEGQLREVCTPLSEQQQLNIEELAGDSKLVVLYLEFIYLYNYIVSIPSIPPRHIFEDGKQNVVPLISSYMSAKEFPGKFEED